MIAIKKNVIFDLDDTLYDHQSLRTATKIAMNNILVNYDIKKKAFYQLYTKYESEYFQKFLTNNISGEVYMVKRYERPLSHFVGDQCRIIAESFRKIYLCNIDSIVAFSEVYEVLENLNREGISCFLLTNGPSSSQRLKIDKLNIKGYFKDIYISEEIGYSKPSKEVFNFVIGKHGLAKEDTLVVGDSMKYDIEGGKMAGLATVLVDRKNRYENYKGSKIKNLIELEKVLRNKG